MQTEKLRAEMLRALHETYYIIFCVNLTTDSHVQLQLSEKDTKAAEWYAEKLSDWLMGFGNSGSVHPDDKQKYMCFANLPYLRQYFREGKNYACCNYRRKVGDEFRWASMEMIPTPEYTHDNQVVLLCIKDVHDGFVVDVTEKDTVTGGCNRKGFLRQAKEILKNSEEGEKFSVVAFDISGFKAINEAFGSEGGDELLHSTYHHIRSCFLKPLLVGRLHGDDFVCLTNMQDIDYDKLFAMSKMNFVQGEKTVEISILSGVYEIEDKSIPVSTMCDYAEMAKKNIVDQYVQPYAVFDKEMRRNYILQTELRARAVEALESGEFRVFYQPVYDAKTGELASAEALIRWEYPVFGMLSPGVFIPALEESGHISKVDAFVIKEVQKLLARRVDEERNTVPISVNLSWMDFYDEKMMEGVIDNVRTTVDAKLLPRFEITETSYAALQHGDGNIINSLHDAGGKLLLDDFGSGYSSFSTIRDYSFDIAKLDMGFIRQINESNHVKSILHSLIDMFHHMDIKVIAEGVEDEEQLAFLRRHNCDYIQGYYFSKPLPQDEFEILLDKNERKHVPA